MEFALLLPLFLMLALGAITGGLAVSSKIEMTQAAREAARYGATLGLESGITSWLTNVKGAVIGAAGSYLPGSAYWCVAYVAPVTISGQQVTESLSSLSPSISATPCFVDSRTDVHVQTELRRTTTFDLAVSSSTLTLDSKSISRYER